MKEHTNAYKAFHYYFNVKVEKLYAVLLSSNLNSFQITGDANSYKRELGHMQSQQRTPYEISRLYDMGANVCLENPNDKVKIYKIVKGMLEDYITALETSIGDINPVNLDEVERFDALLEILHPEVKHLIDEEKNVKPSFKDALSSLSIVKKVKKEETTPYRSYANYIGNLVISKNMPYKRDEESFL